MTVPTYNWVWQQGEDLTMSMVYKEGPEGEETPVNLTGYSLRMDIVLDNVRLFTLNSDDIPEGPPIDNTGPSDNEATLNTDGTIQILVSRALTLSGGDLYSSLTPNVSTIFNYDLFLRDGSNMQRKILRGTITVEPSYTLWP